MHGEAAWNGVAILSRVGSDDVVRGIPDGPGFPHQEARAITATCGGVRVTGVYVPNGRAPGSDHYAYKLRWLAALKDMTSRLIGRFVVSVERATREQHGPGPLTRHHGDLVVPRTARAECTVLKAVAAHYVMYAAERVEIYARQRDVVAELVAAFEADPHRLDPDLRADWDAAEGDAAALRVLLDQVSSLTDVRALSLHRRWCRA